ncbi:hypothetical protein LBC_01730 [Campylobacter sp. 19-13652]|nr:hypothetical protein LBC_01730 [Campylobacter sp. 19-13652]
MDNGNDTYTYTPTLGEDGAYNITITASDIAGNPAEPVSVGITLDTTPPAEPQPVIETVGKNNGYINKDNITPQGASKDNMVTITGSVTGAKVGDTVSIEIDGASKGTGKVALKDGKLGFTVEVKGDDLINATTKSVTAKVTTSDEAGNTSTGTSAPKSYNVDTYLPEPTIDTKHANGDVTIDPYGGTKGGANGKEESDVSNIRVAFSTPENTGGSKDGLVVAANKNEKGEWKISDVKGANKDSVSINETTGVITLKAGSVKEGSDIISTVKDDHGNTSIATGTVQTVPAPEVSIISVLDDTSVTIGSEKRGAGDLLSGKTLSDTLKTNDATPTIKFTVANNFESVNIKVDGVSTNVPRTALTSTVENGKAVYSYTLPQGKLGVDGAHSISVVAVNGAKSSTIEPTIHLDLDTTAGKPTIATSDDGSVSVSAPADAVVVVVGYENGKTVTAQKSGDTWSISGETPAGVSIDTTSGTVKFAAGTLSNGSSVTATAYDDVYNSNEAQAATVNIVPTPTADITAVLDNADSNRKNVSETDLSNGGSNLGSSASPIITNDNTPTIKFSVDNEFDKVKITIDGKETEVAKSSLVSEGGNVYSYTPNVSDGKHSISVVAVNGDKSQTAAVDVLNIDVDTVAPRFRASIEAPSVSEVLDTSKSTVTFKGEIIFSDTNANSTAGSGVNMDTANFNLNVSGHGLINVGKLTPVDGENGKYTYSVEVDKSVFKGATIDSTGNYAVSLQGAVQDNAGNMSNGISTNPVMVNSAILDSIDTTYKVSIQHQKGYDTDLGYASHNHLTGEIYMVDRNDDRGLNSSERQFRYIQSQMTDSNKAFTFDARSVKFGSVWSLSDGNNVTPENIKSKVDTFLSNDVQQNANSALKVYEPNANKALYNDGWGNNNSFTVKLSGYMFMRAGTYKFSGKTDDFLDFKINQSSVNKDTLQDKVVSDDGVTTKSLQKIVDTGSYDTTIVHQASTGNFTSGEIVIAKDAIYPVEIKYADTRYSAELNISYQKKVGNGSYGDSQPLSAEFNHSIYGQRGDDIKFLSKDSFAGVEFDKGAMISVTDLGQYDSLFSYQEGDVIRVTADGEALAENTKITVDGETYLVNKKGDVVINTTEKNGEYDVSLEKDTTNPNDGDKKITFEAKDVSVGETETMDITKVIDKSTGNDIYKLDVSEINDDANKSDVINAGDGNDTVIVTGSGDIDFAKLGKMVDNVEKVELGDKGQTAKGLTTTSIGDILSDASATKHLNISGLEGNKVEIGAAKEVSNSKASITSGDFSEIINSSTEQVAGESSMSIQNPTDTYAVSEAGKTLYIDIDKDLTPVH